MKTLGNLWRASAAMRVTAAALSADAEADLVVIGGGFTGHSAALEAARSGARVILLEAETIGHGGSGRNVGLVNAGLWLPPLDVIKEMGEEAGNRLMAALAAAPAKVWDLIAREGIACEATPNGTLHLAHSPRGFRDLQERHAQGRALGWPMELLGAAETARRVGSQAFHGALFDPRAGTMQPLAYARGLALAAQRAGAILHEQSKVTAARHEGGAWLISCNGHRVRAKSLLLATNAYFDGIDLGFRPEIVAVSYFQLATAPIAEALRSQILQGKEGCWDTALVMSSFRLDQAGRMIIGAIGNLEGAGGAVHADWARRKLAKVYPELAQIPFEHSWRGRIAMTHDHIPKIVDFGPSAYACFGYSGRGIGPGTVFGAATAQALLQDRRDLLPLAPLHGHSERYPKVQECYVEAGAVATHLVASRL